MGRILTGTASWTDPTLLESGWYPKEAESAEDRLRFYASRFSLVEVDSSYYGMPAERTGALWVERTPDDFTFDLKAFRLFTGHPTPVKNLPKVIRDQLPDQLQRSSSVYQKDLPPKLVDETWDMFYRALLPVHQADKLGAVFVQFPKWFYLSRDNMNYIKQLPQRLPGYRVAVEFRQPSWMNEENRNKTLTVLEESGVAYTAVDEPQGTAASVPPVAAATSDLAVVRFHGRRQETWDKPNVGVLDRFRYLYREEELSEWVPKIEALSREAKEVHVLMNNCYSDYSTRNARQLSLLLEQAGAAVAAAAR